MKNPLGSVSDFNSSGRKGILTLSAMGKCSALLRRFFDLECFVASGLERLRDSLRPQGLLFPSFLTWVCLSISRTGHFISWDLAADGSVMAFKQCWHSYGFFWTKWRVLPDLLYKFLGWRALEIKTKTNRQFQNPDANNNAVVRINRATQTP